MLDVLKELSLAVGVPIGCLVLLVGLVIFAGYRMHYPGWEAEIEQLRLDAAKVDIRESEDVMGQAAEINREIRLFQKYNNLWWSDWAIPDKVDHLTVIDLNRGGGL